MKRIYTRGRLCALDPLPFTHPNITQTQHLRHVYADNPRSLPNARSNFHTNMSPVELNCNLSSPVDCDTSTSFFSDNEVSTHQDTQLANSATVQVSDVCKLNASWVADTMLAADVRTRRRQ